MEIENAVGVADAVIVFLSNLAVKKEGYVQKEIKKILSKAEEKPDNTIFIIPLRLDDCDLPRSLRKYHYQDFFPESNFESAYTRLIRSLKIRADLLKINIADSDEYLKIEKIDDTKTRLEERVHKEPDKNVAHESPVAKEQIEENLLLEVERKSALKEKRLARKRELRKASLTKSVQQREKWEENFTGAVQLTEAVGSTNGQCKTDSISFQWDLDPTGFPMIFIEPSGFWMQALPVSRNQFSIFTRNVKSASFVSNLPDGRKRQLEDYFVTGLSYKEAKIFAKWCGASYILPDAKTWKQAYEWLETKPAQVRPDNWQELSRPAIQLWNRIWQLNSPTTLLEQTLMKEGVLEWTVNRDSLPHHAGGMGKPFHNLWQVLRAPTDNPVYPRSDISAFGLRLFRR